MKKGEVWWVNFEPSMGGGIRKQRPAVIVSNDAANLYLNRVQVEPLTSSIDKLYPGEAYVTFRGKKGQGDGRSAHYCQQETFYQFSRIGLFY